MRQSSAIINETKQNMPRGQTNQRERKRIRKLALVDGCSRLFVNVHCTALLSLFCLKHLLLCQQRSESSRQRELRERLHWPTFRDGLTSFQFKRMFRMPKECFDLLCSNIEAAVGAKAFCSHDFINTYLRSLDTPEGRMRNAAEAINGDYICGEAKVALVLRMMAGASYIDIVLIFGISYSHCYEIFHAVISNWICNDAVLPYLGEMYLTQDNEMGRTANEFATKGRHQDLTV